MWDMDEPMPEAELRRLRNARAIWTERTVRPTEWQPGPDSKVAVAAFIGSIRLEWAAGFRLPEDRQ